MKSLLPSPSPPAEDKPIFIQGLLTHYGSLLDKYQCVCFSVHFQTGPLRDMRTILETFLEEYIPSNRTHELDEVGCSTKMLQDGDFAYDIRRYLLDDKGRIKKVRKNYRCSSCRCPVITMRKLVKSGRKIYKRDEELHNHKLDLWLKVLSTETPLAYCEFLEGDANPQVHLSSILQRALLNPMASEDNDDGRIYQRHINMMDSDRARVMTMREQFRDARDTFERRYGNHHCGLDWCGIKTALEWIRTTYRLSKVEVKLIARKQYLWEYEFDV
ncbi:hypothetical protein BGX34_006333 [Mortierella sp. NVP85]|nr:hypothetical protein BGX34_006333 [Mortierella sp. NVP85]